MDINILRGIATVVVMSSFLAICWWAYVIRSKESFNEAAALPFADERDGGQPHSKTGQSRGAPR